LIISTKYRFISPVSMDFLLLFLFAFFFAWCSPSWVVGIFEIGFFLSFISFFFLFY